MSDTPTAELAAALARRSRLKTDERDRPDDGKNATRDEDRERLPLPLIPF